MSDIEANDIEQNNTEIVDEIIAETLKKADKRKATSKANLAKARATKIANLKREKEIRESSMNLYEDEYTDDDSESSEESETELVLTKAKVSKQKTPNIKKIMKQKRPESSGNRDIQEIKSIMARLLEAQLKAKKKKPRKSQITVQMPAYPPPAAPKQPSNPKMENLKKKLIDL